MSGCLPLDLYGAYAMGATRIRNLAEADHHGERMTC